MKLFDNHIHSLLSADSDMPIRDIVDAAVAKGLSGVALTDHYDFEIPEGVKSFTFDPKEQSVEIEKCLMGLPVETASTFKILKGVEIGMQPQCIDDMNKLVESNDFDTVVGSLHFIDGTDPFHGNYYIHTTTKRPTDTILRPSGSV